MPVSQMFVHLQIISQLALGELQLKRSLLGIVGGPIAKLLFVNKKPFPKSLVTDKGLIVVGQKEFEEEKNKLIELVKKFQSVKQSMLDNSKHPIFGNLTADEWDTLTWKHVDHHLRQFGA